MECQFCKQNFKNISSLNKHQKTTKYCLEIQGKTQEYKCICEKSYKNINLYEKHIEKCLNMQYLNLQKKLEDIIEEKDKIIHDKEIMIVKLIAEKEEIIREKEEIIREKDLQICKSLAEVSVYEKNIKNVTINTNNYNTNHNTNNTNCNNSLNINSSVNFNNVEEISKLINDYYDINYIVNGQAGIAEFALDNYIKDDNGKYKYICTDPSRHVFKHKDMNGNIIKDIEAKNLVKFLIDGGIKDKAVTTSEKWYTKEDGSLDQDKAQISIKNCESILNLEKDNTAFRKHLAKLTSI